MRKAGPSPQIMAGRSVSIIATTGPQFGIGARLQRAMEGVKFFAEP